MVSGADAEIDSKDTLLNALDSVNADILFLRHALAPGFGDPDNFDLKDCDTQRNLDAKGRSQASKIGEELRLRISNSQKFYQVSGVGVKKQQIY